MFLFCFNLFVVCVFFFLLRFFLNFRDGTSLFLFNLILENLILPIFLIIIVNIRYSGMSRNVPEYSGMFHVPGFIDRPFFSYRYQQTLFIQLIYYVVFRNATYQPVAWLHISAYKPHATHNSSICSDEGPTLETSASRSRCGGQFILSTQLIKPNFLVILPTTQPHIQFLYKLTRFIAFVKEYFMEMYLSYG